MLPSCGRKPVGELDDAQLLDRFGTLGANADGHELPRAEPPSEAELQRRRAARLTPEEDALLLRWGYPFVLERFRFHMSLTGSLRDADAGVVAALRTAAQKHFAPLLSGPPPRFDTISLFAEPTPGGEFRCLEQMELAR